MRAILDRSDELVAWAGERLRPFADNTTAIGVADDAGKVLGVVCFHSWEPWNRTMEVSAVSEDARWLLARDAWRQMFAYAFEACGVDKLWSRTPAKNERALRFLRALKFKREAVLSRQFGDDDAVISCLFRWDYEQQEQNAKAA